jgi:hypothetical protein
MHKLMCIVLSAVVIALCRAIRVVCLHDVSMIAIGVEGADQGGEEPSHHHVAPGLFLPHEPSQKKVLGEKPPDMLMSLNILAHLLAKQVLYDDSGNLYEQPCAAYDTVLGQDHRTTRAYHQHYQRMLALQEQHRMPLNPNRPETSVGISKRSRIARGLAKGYRYPNIKIPHGLGELQVYNYSTFIKIQCLFMAVHC